MITMHTLPALLTGNALTEALLQWMSTAFEDFSPVQAHYHRAVDDLQKELGKEFLSDVTEAIAQQTSSNLLFSAALGLKANLDNFIDPLTRNFLDADPEIYLRENTARQLPQYQQSQKTLDRFYAALSSRQKACYEDVIAYLSYLETVVPKLGHYYGYILGDRLFPRIVPGYHDDPALGTRYHMMLEDYFGKAFLLQL